MTAYKFVRMKGGVGAYAGLTLERIPGPSGNVEWIASLAIQQKRYGLAVKQGILDALAWSAAESAFRVVEFIYLEVDTNNAAVRCAATVAAFKELGGDEAQLNAVLDGEWRIQHMR